MMERSGAAHLKAVSRPKNFSYLGNIVCRKLLFSQFISKLLGIFTLLVLFLLSCQSADKTSSVELLGEVDVTKPKSQNVTATHSPFPSKQPTKENTPPPPTKTSAPSLTPTHTPTMAFRDWCINSGHPDSFEPTIIPEMLRIVDEQILNQTSWRTETSRFYFSSYGAASYGSTTELKSYCREMIPSPNILSYCEFDRETSRVHVMSGEIQGTLDKMINESFVRGRASWVRPEGGSWYLTSMLDDAMIENASDAYQLAPFFSREIIDCQYGVDFPDLTKLGLDKVCFAVNVPKFIHEMLGWNPVSNVECVTLNQGIIWIDPRTNLPTRMDIMFNVSVYFEEQEAPLGYNVFVDMSKEFLAFNESFVFPNP